MAGSHRVTDLEKISFRISKNEAPFGVLRWFQLFCFFHLVSAVCLTDCSLHKWA